MRAPLCRARRWLHVGALVASACAIAPTAISEGDVRLATTTVLADFFARHPPSHWPRVFVSDEYIRVGIDSQFLKLLPPSTVPIDVAHRSDVWVGFGLVIDGGLLLEPAQPASGSGGIVSQTLNFWSTRDFGGELRYELKRTLQGTWEVTSMKVVWVF